VTAKAQAKAWQTVARSVAIHASKQSVAASKPFQASLKSDLESDSADWEQRIQVRLMELDVDPGNDADQAAITKSRD
ncbi:MAG TPA: hypothetical protein VG272_09165, partial [Candidatus Acidoferrales bacterium]|nr:hypothetical protein [Candidatus Acidoferrales bacterium]